MCKHSKTLVEEKGKKKKRLQRLVCCACGMPVTGWKSPDKLHRPVHIESIARAAEMSIFDVEYEDPCALGHE